MPLNWRDVIDIEPDDRFESTSAADTQSYRHRLENFLNSLQDTTTGQTMLRSIQEKYAEAARLDPQHMRSSKLQISLNDFFRSVTSPGGRITLDIRDERYLAFMDQVTGQPRPMTFESAAFHELFHAADKRVIIGQDNQNANFTTAVEEGATFATDRYAQRYEPSWGVRGAYWNIAGHKPERILNMEGQAGTDILNNDTELREKIAEMVRTAPDRMAQAERSIADPLTSNPIGAIPLSENFARQSNGSPPSATLHNGASLPDASFPKAVPSPVNPP